MKYESRAKFLNDYYAEKAMYLALIMAGIEAEVSFCIIKPPYMPADIGLPFKVCIASGRIWDVASHFDIPQACEAMKEAMTMEPWPWFPAKSPRDYLPLPSDDDIKTHPLKVAQALKAAKIEYHLSLGMGTELDPFFTDKIPYQELVIKREAREKLSYQYMEIEDRESIIKMYGKENIENFMEESIENFKERLDSLIEKYPDTNLRSRNLSSFEHARWKKKKTDLSDAFHAAKNKDEIIERNKRTVTRFTDLIDPNRIKKIDEDIFTCPLDCF